MLDFNRTCVDAFLTDIFATSQKNETDIQKNIANDREKFNSFSLNDRIAILENVRLYLESTGEKMKSLSHIENIDKMYEENLERIKVIDTVQKKLLAEIKWPIETESL